MAKANQSRGSTREQTKRGYKDSQRPLGALMERALMGQLVNPPNTAIGVPLQQSISNLQGGSMGMANAFGVGGTPLGQTGGLQSREQLGLPDRRDYFTFLPTADQVSALGAVPKMPSAPGGGKARRRYDRAVAKGNDQKAAKIARRHPEFGEDN